MFVYIKTIYYINIECHATYTGKFVRQMVFYKNENQLS